MRLETFRVTHFRNIVDSGEVTVDDVTCLVGKNEAGKSALLEGLHHLNPAKPAVALKVLDEYPRWLLKEHEVEGRDLEKATAIKATFTLSDDELHLLRERFGQDVIRSGRVVAKRSYGDSTFSLECDVDESAFVRNAATEFSPRLIDALDDPSDVGGLIDRLQILVEVDADSTATAKRVATDAGTALTKLSASLGNTDSLTLAIHAQLEPRVPRTFHFSSYSQLRGRYTLEEVFRAVHNGSTDEEVQAAADFLHLARIKPESIENWDFEASNAELEAASSLLTKRVKEHWKQNNHLKLSVKLETQREQTHSGSGVERFLQFRVEDTRHDFSNRLDRRSTGFRWFISFLASFLEFERDQDLILLLDEPGLTLHARAQMDLLEAIDKRLAAGRQVIYSTHSPFMVSPTRLRSTRIVEDRGPEVGSVVVNEAGIVSDPDTLFPLQASLGYDVMQSILIGNQNVLVEGISDFIYLTWFSNEAKQAGRPGLPETCRVLPAGGASKMPTFLALLGTQLDVVVLLDANSDRQRIDEMCKHGKLDETMVLSTGDFADVKGADIEDLFTPGEYLANFNSAFGTSLKVRDLTGEDRIIKRIERATGKSFDHGVVAGTFLQKPELWKISEGTHRRFDALIARVTSALP